MKLKAIARPEGQSEAYQFLQAEGANGSRFKVKAGFGRPGVVKAPDGETDVQSGDFAISVSTSMVDADGKAVVDENQVPIVDVMSRTFTPADVLKPGFDLDLELATLITERAAAVEARAGAAAKARGLVGGWGKGPVALPFNRVQS
jgi:hypothetical protein